VVRLHRARADHLRRVLGIPTLFSVGYGDVGSSIYYALGLVALSAMGATPIALGIAGLLFAFTALTYAEGAAMFPEAGGSASFARHGFNDLFGFLAGWSLIFGYIVTIAISAYTVPSYLAYFWPPFKDSLVAGPAMAMSLVGFLMLINVLGVKESSFLNLLLAVMDILLQVTIIVVGFLLLFEWPLLKSHILDFWPSTSNLVFGVAIATIAFTGIESVSQMAQEARHPEKRVPAAIMLMIVVVLVIYAGISLVALSAMTPHELAVNWATDPMAGVAQGIRGAIHSEEVALRLARDPAQVIVLHWVLETFRNLLPLLVAVLAATILTIATNAGILGISRVAFSLGDNRQLPPLFSRVHHRFKTPFISIAVFSLVALLILSQGFRSTSVFANMGGLYAFGSMLSFALAHASIISLRVRNPRHRRPFRLWPNLIIKGRAIPLTALLGLLGTAAVWVVIVIMQPYSRVVGFLWLLGGLLLYSLFRWGARLSLTQAPPTREER
jgi:APA family basic amino acid/polyamine antiporter